MITVPIIEVLYQYCCATQYHIKEAEAKNEDPDFTKLDDVNVLFIGDPNTGLESAETLEFPDEQSLLFFKLRWEVLAGKVK